MKHQRAVRYFLAGQQLAASGDKAAALERFRVALQLAPSQNYALALANVLMDLDRWHEAEARLAEILQRDPTDAQANLMMARIRSREGDVDEAILYYHRAIYGLWSGHPTVNRIAARFELIAFLEQHHYRQLVVSELQQIRAELPDDPVQKERAAALFLTHGMVADAADLYREAIHVNSRDAKAYAGLGQALFLAGNYRDAAPALHRAVALAPDDAASRTRLETNQAILAADPSARGLNGTERARRARNLLQRSLESLQHCAPNPPAALVSSAQHALRTRPRADAADAEIGLAEEIWQERVHSCPQNLPEEVLARVFARLAQ